MQNNKLTLESAENIIRSHSYDLLNYNTLYYYDLCEKGHSLKSASELFEYKELMIGIELTIFTPEDLERLLLKTSIKITRLDRKNTLAQIKISKRVLLSNDELLEVLDAVGSANDFLFFILNPEQNAELYNVSQKKVIIDLRLADCYLTYDYDGVELFVFL